MIPDNIGDFGKNLTNDEARELAGDLSVPSLGRIYRNCPKTQADLDKVSLVVERCRQ